MPSDSTTSVVRGRSDSTTGLTDSDLHKKALCHYVANVAKGCPHSCSFCYNRAAPQYVFDPGSEIEERTGKDGSGDWGEYALYRDYLPEAVARDIRTADTFSRKGRGVVGLSFGTDPYFDPEVATITGQTLRVLRDWLRPTRILTRNPALAWHTHGPLFAEMAQLGLLTVGSSIPALAEDEVAAIEPNAPPVQHRLDALATISAAGIPVFVSMSPTYPTLDRDRLRTLLREIKRVDPDVVFHEPINPRKGNLEASAEAAHDAGEAALAAGLDRIRDRDQWAEYAVRQFRHVQDLAAGMDIPIYLWPDEQLVSRLDGAQQDWLQAWRDRQSPEPFPHRPTPTDARPAIPDVQDVIV